MLLDLTHSLQLRPTRVHVLWELANCISSAVGADDFRLYLAETGETDPMTLYIGQDCWENGEPKMQKVTRTGGALSVPTYVGRTREAIRLSRGDIDARFPDGISNKVSRTQCGFSTRIARDILIRLMRRAKWHTFCANP